MLLNGTGSGADTVFTTNSVTPNVWSHVVVASNGSGSFDVSINGVTESIAVAGEGLSSSAAHMLGAFNSNTVTADYYLSDYYFVEQALEPEVFGKSFEGRWGPLDSVK